MVHEKAVITTDGWRGYQKATEGKWHNNVLLAVRAFSVCYY